jgi:hypothetical protein
MRFKGGAYSVACTVASTCSEDPKSIDTCYRSILDSELLTFINKLGKSIFSTHKILANNRQDSTAPLRDYQNQLITLCKDKSIVEIYTAFKNCATKCTSRYDSVDISLSPFEMIIFKYISSFGSKRFRRFLKRKLETFRGAYQLSQFKRFFQSQLPQVILDYEKKKYGEDLKTLKKTDRNIISYIEMKSQQYFKGFKIPDLVIHTSNKACLEGSRNRDFLLNAQRPISVTQVDEYFRQVDTISQECEWKSFNQNTTVRHIQVQEPLKVRNLTAMPAHHQILKNFQLALKAWIDKDPTFRLTNNPDILSAVRSMNWPDHLLFTSGDYSAATDTIHRDAVMAAISGINSDLLKTSFDNFTIVDSEGHFLINQNNGQLMGSLISFIVLCLINKWIYEYTQELSEEKSTSPLINGDDILFKSTEKFHNEWREIIRKVGFRPSPGKNFLHKNYFTINSRPFLYNTGTYEKLRFINGKVFKLYNDLNDYCRELKENNNGMNIKSQLHFYRELGMKLSTKNLTKRQTKFIHKPSPLVVGGCDLDIEDKMTDLKKAYQYVFINKQPLSNDPATLWIKKLKYPTLFGESKISEFSIKGYKNHLHKDKFIIPTYGEVISNKRPYTYTGYSIFNLPSTTAACATSILEKY